MPKTSKPARRALTVVTHNPGKIREFRVGLASLPLDLHHLDRTYHELQADTLEEVASFGLQELASEVEGDFCLEDSGLFIDALGGFPGVYSAYVFRTIGLAGLLKLLRGSDDRRARFASVVALSWDGETHLFRGEARGSIARAARGTHGFGYDPIFVAEGERKTFGEMAVEAKMALSHRGRAIDKLAPFLARQMAGRPARR